MEQRRESLGNPISRGERFRAGKKDGEGMKLVIPGNGNLKTIGPP